MTAVLFFIAAIGASRGAVGVVALRNPFYSVLALVVHLLALAVLFLLLTREFVAAAQVVVYAGAVMVLYVFVVAYVGDAERARCEPGRRLGPARRSRSLACGALFVELRDRGARLGPARRSTPRARTSTDGRLRHARRRSASCC